MRRFGWLVKVVATTLLGFALLNAPAFGQTAYQPYFALGTIDLTSGTDSTLLSYSGAGWLTSVACRVTAIPSNVTAYDIRVAIDGSVFQALSVFSLNSWVNNVIPYQTFGSTSSSGANVGDTFVLPFNVAFSSSVTIKSTKTLNTSPSGSLACTTIYGH